MRPNSRYPGRYAMQGKWVIAKQQVMAENAASATEQSLGGNLDIEEVEMKSFSNALLLVVGLALLPIPHAWAAPLSEFKPQSNTTIRDTLVALQDERVTLSLDSGKQIGGKVILVGDSIVYLQLAGKFFHRAVVNLDEISAIILEQDY